MFKAIGKWFKNMLSSLWKWIKKHWKEILIAIIIIIVVAIGAYYVLPALKAFLSAKIIAFDAWFGSKFGLAAGSFGFSKLFKIGAGAAAVAKLGASAGANLVGSSNVGSGIINTIIKLIKDTGGVIADNGKLFGGIGLAAFFMKNKTVIILIFCIFIGIKLLERRRME